MAYVQDNLKPLSDLGNFELSDDDQDIRGRPLVSEDGRTLGRIDDLMIDRDAKRVASVRLDNGATVPVEGLVIEKDRVIDKGAAGAHAAGSTARDEWRPDN